MTKDLRLRVELLFNILKNHRKILRQLRASRREANKWRHEYRELEKFVIKKLGVKLKVLKKRKEKK